MPTLITEESFDQLKNVRDDLVVATPLAPGKPGRVAGICIPWAGHHLIVEGGIYYVGIGTCDDFYADEEHTFQARLRVTENHVQGREGAGTPFWQFLDGLTLALFGAPVR